MALESTTVSVEFGQGLDSKTDSKVTAKPVLIQDGIFTNPRRISKRNGFDSVNLSILTGGSISSPTMFSSYRNEAICAGTSPSTGQRLFSRSTSLSKWIDKGKYVSAKVSKQVLATPELSWINNAAPALTLGAINSSGAYLSNIAAYGFDQDIVNHASPSSASVFFTIVDTQTNVHISERATIVSAYGTTQGFSKMVALGSSRFALFYVSSTGGVAKLCFQTITVSGSGVSLGAEVVLNTVSSSVGWVYDVQTTAGGAFVALANGSSVVLYTLDTTGATTHGPTTVVTGGNVATLSIQLDTIGTNAWVYWLDSGTTLKYAIYNASTLASVLSATNVATGLSSVRQVTALATSSTTQSAYWSTVVEVASSFTVGVYYPTIYQNVGLNQSGTGGTTASVWRYGIDIYSKPFTVSSVNYMACMSLSQTNPIGLIVDLSDGLPVAKFLVGEAEGVYGQGYDTSSATYSSPSFNEFRWPGFLNTAMAFSATNVGLACGLVVSLSTVAPTSSSNLAAFPAIATTGVTMGVCMVSFDFNHIDAYQAIVQQDTLVMNGGIIEQYDGAGVTELGYTIDPDQVTAKGSTTLGVLGSGRFVYFIVYRWTDANGNLHESAPSPGLVVNFTSGTTNKVDLQWAPLILTQKLSVTVDIYRTTANGTIAYLIASQANTGSGYNGSGFQDNNAPDSTVIANPQIYTVGGAILENIAPPPSMIFWNNNNRLWCVDSENPETTIEYSKTSSQGTGIRFSTGQLELVIDSRGGEISGASPMDEKTVIGKTRAVGYFVGDGANDAGSGSTITGFTFVPYDTGVTNSKSVRLYPGGVIFKSPKGIYKIDRGVNLTYFGAEVEAYNSQDVRSVVIVSDKNQIRFLTSSGNNLLYDYAMNQWSVFTSPAGLSADIFQNNYTYVTASGSIYQENTTTFLDNGSAYGVLAKLQFIKASSVQNFQRLRRTALLGDYTNGSSAGHAVQISAAYDFGTTFSTPIAYTLGASSSSGSFQYREGLPRQKCDSIQLLIQEVTTGASGEYIDFTDLGLEIAVKKGLNKLPASRSV